MFYLKSAAISADLTAVELRTSGLETSMWQLQITGLQLPVEKIKYMLHNSLPLKRQTHDWEIPCSGEDQDVADFLFQFNA